MKTKNDYSNMLTFLFTNENGEARTLDLQIKSLLLYHLSYIPKGLAVFKENRRNSFVYATVKYASFLMYSLLTLSPRKRTSADILCGE